MRGIENNIPFEKVLMDDAKVRGARLARLVWNPRAVPGE
jgi:hypothetical protein